MQQGVKSDFPKALCDDFAFGIFNVQHRVKVADGLLIQAVALAVEADFFTFRCMECITVLLPTCGQCSIDNGWELDCLDIPVCRCFRKRSHFKAETGRNPEVGDKTDFTRTGRRIFRDLELRRDNASTGACLQKVNDSVPVILRDIGSAKLDHPVDGLGPAING